MIRPNPNYLFFYGEAELIKNSITNCIFVSITNCTFVSKTDCTFVSITTKSKTKRHLPWITRNIKCEIRKKDRQYRKARKSKKHEDWSAYRIKRQQLQKLLRSAHDDSIRNVIGASLLDRGNQKKCWSFVKLNRTENVGIPILCDTNGLHITNQAKAECLNTQFVSVFTSDDGKHLPDKGLSPYLEMDTIQFTQPGIEILLKNIDQTKATGPAELPERMLKETAKEIAGVLSVIFQQSYEEGTVPSDWLTARISAIYIRKVTRPIHQTTDQCHSHA